MLKYITAFLTIITASFLISSCGTYKNKYSYRFGDDGLIYNAGNDELYTGTILDTADVVIEFQVVDGKKNGEFKTYYLNGQIEKFGYVINNENMGEWKYYYQDGQMETKGTFKNNKPEGIWTSYYPNGNISCEGIYKKGKQQSAWTYYNEKGEIINIIFYQDGEFVGLQERFS